MSHALPEQASEEVLKWLLLRAASVDHAALHLNSSDQPITTYFLLLGSRVSDLAPSSIAAFGA